MIHQGPGLSPCLCFAFHVLVSFFGSLVPYLTFSLSPLKWCICKQFQIYILTLNLTRKRHRKMLLLFFSLRSPSKYLLASHCLCLNSCPSLNQSVTLARGFDMGIDWSQSWLIFGAMHGISKSRSHNEEWGKSGSHGKIWMLVTKRERKVWRSMVTFLLGTWLPWYQLPSIMISPLSWFSSHLRLSYFNSLWSLLLLCLSVNIGFFRIQSFLLAPFAFVVHFCIVYLLSFCSHVNAGSLLPSDIVRY